MPRTTSRVPLWIKLAYSLLVGVVVPFYLVHHGWRNFLWLSDIALLTMTVALWLEHRLLASVMAVGTLLFEFAWLLDFVLLLMTGQAPLRIAGYMADPAEPLFLRGLSLFHLALPPVMLYCLHRLGYDRRAWPVMAGFAAVLMPLTRGLTTPEANINWVYGPGTPPAPFAGPLYVLVLVAIMAGPVYGLTHWVLTRLFSREGAGREHTGR